MSDATDTVNVDGVEPSIPVFLLDVKGNPERVKLFTAEDGTERFLVKGAEAPLLVTNGDLANLGGFEIEIVNDSPSIPAPSGPQNPVQPAQNRPEVVSSPVQPTPGQSG